MALHRQGIHYAVYTLDITIVEDRASFYSIADGLKAQNTLA